MEKKLIVTDLDKEFYTDFLVPYFKSLIKDNVVEGTVESILKFDFYPVLEKFLPQLLYCVLKRKTSDELTLFAEDNPDFNTFGIKYTGDLDIDEFWAGLRKAGDFSSKDFFIRVYTEKLNRRSSKPQTRPNVEIDDDGCVVAILRGGEKGKSCLIVEKNFDTYDCITAPDSILGACKQSELANNLKEWTVACMEKFGFFEDVKA